MISTPVLYVEDCSITRHLMATLLFGNECPVDVARDGREALVKLLSHEWGYYRLIVTDYQMPVIDGILLSQIVLSSAYPTKLVVFSGSNSTDLQRDLLPHQPEVFHKDDVVAFRRYVRELLEGLSAEASPAAAGEAVVAGVPPKPANPSSRFPAIRSTSPSLSCG
jgi:CheY-like chemotaxis protein